MWEKYREKVFSRKDSLLYRERAWKKERDRLGGRERECVCEGEKIGKESQLKGWVVKAIKFKQKYNLQ